MGSCPDKNENLLDRQSRIIKLKCNCRFGDHILERYSNKKIDIISLKFKNLGCDAD